MLLAAPVLHAADAPATGDGPTVSWSAFGTVGATRSDQAWHYQRFISDDMSFDRDSVFGAQADVQLNPQWSATVQARLAPSARDDGRWDLTAAWAFAAWRPDNDWLVRAGKLRVPFMMRSEQLDVGQTYDEARLPSEIYSLAPTSDFTGMHVSRSWARANGDLGLEGYFGNSDLYKRFWVRDAVPSPVPGQEPLLPAGATFKKVNVSVAGLVLSWRAPSLTARVGMHQARTRRLDDGGFAVRPVWVDIGPGMGFWSTDGEQTSRIRNRLFTLGVEARLGGGWRVASEAMRIVQRDTETGVAGWAGYTTVYRSIGAFTPYATYSGSNTSAGTAEWQRRLDTTVVPGFIPGAATINAGMRANADTTPVYRQRSVAIGTSYALTTSSKLKFEWLNTRATQSLLVDAPSGEPIDKPRRVNVLSASYSFVF
jgi:hypothetical protein